MKMSSRGVAIVLVYHLSLTLIGLLLEVKSSVVVLNHQNLTDVPSDVPLDTQHLDLSYNRLRIIKNNSFLHLDNLRRLNLSNNQIKALEPLAFAGLHRLVFLSLNGNNLRLSYSSYPPSVFEPLVSLESLITDNNEPTTQTSLIMESYPDEAFSPLKSLRELAIDLVPNITFGKGFQGMKQLRSLSVSCQNPSVTVKQHTFNSFRDAKVSKLSIACDFVENGTLDIFSRLSDVQVDAQGLDGSLRMLSHFSYRNLTSIAIRDERWRTLDNPIAVKDSFVLTPNNTQYLATICVKTLDLFRNKIIRIESAAILGFQFPECLETLSLADNHLEIGTSIRSIIAFRTFTNLRRLDISTAHRNEFGYRRKRTLVQLSIPLPSRLEFLNASYVLRVNSALPLRIFNGSNLKILDVSFPIYLTCRIKVKGLDNLTVLNITRSDCSSLWFNFFNQFPSLEELVASSCQLNMGLEQNQDGQVFRQLTQLKKLDLSNNGLARLNKDLFLPLKSLEYLNLANNKLVHLPHAIYILRSLGTLDLSTNVLSSLSQSEINILTRIAASFTNKTLTLMLKHNPLLCTCETHEFVNWAVTKEISVKLNPDLQCRVANSTTARLSGLRKHIKDFNVKCVSKFWITFSVVGSSLLVVFLVAAILIYRHRRYLYYWIVSKLPSAPSYHPLETRDYKYDVFVAYNQVNYRFVCYELREFLEEEHSYTACLHHRDFQPGTYIVDSIIDAINNSRKIILVVSQAFLASDWCDYEIQMSRMRICRDGVPNALIVVMLEEIHRSKMPRSLLSIWDQIVFLPWSGDGHDGDIFWSKLANALK